MRSNVRGAAAARSDSSTMTRALERVAAIAAASRGGAPRLVTLTIPIAGEVDPLAWLAAAPGELRFYWQERGRWIAGIGAAAVVRASGVRRFAHAGALATSLLGDALVEGPRGGGPLLLGGFAFDDAVRSRFWRGFPALRMVVPRTAMRSRNGRTVLTISVFAGSPDVRTQLRAASQDLGRLDEAAGRLGPPPRRVVLGRSVPPDAAWLRAVSRAAADVRLGRLAKLVLARAREVRAPEPIEPAAIVARLVTAQPGATVFWVGTPGASFVGATPEWLVRVRGRDVRTGALAGSLAADRPGGALLASAKDQGEHSLVVQGILEQLAPICDAVHAAPRPVVTSIGYIQHLHTAIGGRLRERLGVLEVAGRLHPTPAIAGAPRPAALAALRSREGIERGWYGGGVGWIDAAGDGEVAVAIRSALIRGARARMFAGAGVVSASHPSLELAETEAKLAPMLAAFGLAA